MSTPAGLIPPLHTPFLDDGTIDEAGLAQEARRLEAAGIAWVLVTGVGGEWPSLSLSERKRIVEILVAARRELRLLVHVGTPLMHDVVDLIAHAEKAGADAVMASGPYVFGFPQADIRTYYETLAARTSLPFLIYNNPGGTGLKISPRTIIELSHVPNIVGLKDSSRDGRELTEIKAAADPKFMVLAGEGDLMMASLGAGADGAMPAPALIAPERCLRIYNLYRDGSVEAALEEWWQLWPLIAALGAEGRYIPMVKLALELSGRPAGRCRPPLAQDFDPTVRARLSAILGDLALLPQASRVG